MKPSGNATHATGDVWTATECNNIETALKSLEVVSALPAAGLAGRLVLLSTDGRLYVDTGTTWDAMARDVETVARDLLSFAANNSLTPRGGVQFIDPFDESGIHTRTGPWREESFSDSPQDHYYVNNVGTSAAQWKVAFTGTGIALLTLIDSSVRTLYVSIDGGVFAALSVLPTVASGSLMYRKQLAGGLAYGSHTVAFYVNEAVALVVGGIEVVADSSPHTDAGTAYVSGTRVAPAAAMLAPDAIGTAKSRVDLIGVGTNGTVALTQGTNDVSVKAYRIEETGVVSRYFLKDASGKYIVPPHSNITLSDGPKVWKNGFSTISASPQWSNGAILYSSTSGDYVVIGFCGTGLDLIGHADAAPAADSVTVIIDDGTATSISAVIPIGGAQKSLSVASGLAYGYHKVKINLAAAPGTIIYIDAFDVYVPQAPATPANTLALGHAIIMPTADTTTGAFNAARSAAWVREEVGSGDIGIVIGGANWSINTNPVLSNGSSRVNTNANTTDTLEFAFVGTGVRMIGPTGTNAGIYAISIDGAAAVNVDLYTAAAVTHAIQYVSSGLSFGTHTVKITTTNTKNASSTALTIPIDAFDVLTPIETRDVRTLSPVADQARLLMDAHIDPLGNPHVQYLRVLDVNAGKSERNFRSEMSSASVTIATAGTEVTAAVTFNRAFAVPPKVYMTFSAWPGSGGYNNAKPTSITTTGFTYTGNSYATGTLSVYWIAIGY